MKLLEELLQASEHAPKILRSQREYIDCGRCGNTKHRDEFYDGIKGKKDTWCKECKKEYNRTVIANRSRKAKNAQNGRGKLGRSS